MKPSYILWTVTSAILLSIVGGIFCVLRLAYSTTAPKVITASSKTELVTKMPLQELDRYVSNHATDIYMFRVGFQDTTQYLSYTDKPDALWAVAEEIAGCPRSQFNGLAYDEFYKKTIDGPWVNRLNATNAELSERLWKLQDALDGTKNMGSRLFVSINLKTKRLYVYWYNT